MSCTRRNRKHSKAAARATPYTPPAAAPPPPAALPYPSPATIARLRRLASHPHEFAMQDPRSVRQPRVLADGSVSRAFLPTNPELAQLRAPNSLVVMNWCMGGKESTTCSKAASRGACCSPLNPHSKPGREPCEQPHPCSVGIVSTCSEYGNALSIRRLYLWDPTEKRLVDYPDNYVGYVVRPAYMYDSKHALWLRVLPTDDGEQEEQHKVD